VNTPNYPPPPPGGQPPYGGQPAGGPPPPGYGPPPPAYGPPPGQSPYGPPPSGPPQTPPGGQYPPPPGGGPGYTPPLPPPPKKAGMGIGVRILIAVVVLAVAGGIALFTSKDSPNNAEVGDCIKVNKAAEEDADVQKIDCKDSTAVYKVGAKSDSGIDDCPKGDYQVYTETGDNRLTLCLVLNAEEGDCFQEVENADGTLEHKRVECTSPDAAYQVGKIFDTMDVSQCGPDFTEDEAYLYSQPSRTYCLVAPDAAAGGDPA
jgi:hypothetical protein